MRIIPDVSSPDFARRCQRLALALLIVSVGMRLLIVATGQIGLVQDEAQYWDWTRHPQWSYYSKGPLIARITSYNVCYTKLLRMIQAMSGPLE